MVWDFAQTVACVCQPKVQQYAFHLVSFLWPSCLMSDSAQGSLLISQYKHKADRESPHQWLVRPGKDLASYYLTVSLEILEGK